MFNEYKKVRNLVRRETRNRAEEYQLNVAHACKNNPKKFWQFIKSKTTTTSNVSDLQVTVGSETHTVTDDLEKAEKFAKFFS